VLAHIPPGRGCESARAHPARRHSDVKGVVEGGIRDNLRIAYACAATLAVLCALTAASKASAQVTLVGPFVGDHSETWEEFPRGANPQRTPILGGLASISGTDLVIAGHFIMCSVKGRPSDGINLMDSDRPCGPFTISFVQPVSAFGAYWGSGIYCTLCCGFGDSPSILTFKDVNGTIIGTDSFAYTGNGKLMWRGYHFSTPVKTIIRTARDGLEGFATDGLQAIVAPSAPGRLSNISTRGFVQTGNDVLIAGLIISGSGSKNVLLRVLGPTLGQAPFNLSNAMANPALDLFQGSTHIASNDNWVDASNKPAIAATGLAPPNVAEAAILTNLNPGSYTAVARGVNNTGLALVEAYDLNSTAGSKFANISTRGFVGIAANVMIAGVTVQGTQSESVIVRGLGPTLTQFGVASVLADPVLDLRDANGNSVRANDNWKDTQQAQIQASGYAPPNNLESAIAATLAAGTYTAILSGKNNTTGNALVEVYGLN
jgi:hypothetical protein